jgi:AcrR family transcriptional regulator
MMNDELIVLQDDPRPHRADAVKNRALLLDTAKRLFDERGVDNVSMSAVAEAAGVGKATLYRNFTNKTELCLGLLDHDQRDLQERTLLRLRAMPHQPLENLRWFVREVSEFIERNRRWVDLENQGSLGMLSHPAHLWWRHTLYGLLAQLGASGDVEYTADVLYTMLSVPAMEFQRTVLGYDLARVQAGLDAMIDRLLALP